MYAVEFSHRSGRDLVNMAKKRTNVIPIVEDARHPHKYRMLVGAWRNIHISLQFSFLFRVFVSVLLLLFVSQVWLMCCLPMLRSPIRRVSLH